MTKIEQSEKLIQWEDKKIDGQEFKVDGRRELVASSLDVALEHQKAIILLISKKYYGSAFSLIRIIFETYVRSLWLNYCATEQDLEDFKINKLQKKFYQLISDVEKIEGYKGGTLSKAKKAGWEQRIALPIAVIIKLSDGLERQAFNLIMIQKKLTKQLILQTPQGCSVVLKSLS